MKGSNALIFGPLFSYLGAQMEVSWRIIELTLRYQVLTGALGCAVLAFVAPGLLAPFATGALLMIANLLGSRTLVRKGFGGDRPSLLYGLGMIFKFMTIAIALALLVLVVKVDAVGLVLGFGSALFLGVTGALIHCSALAPSPEAS